MTDWFVPDEKPLDYTAQVYALDELQDVLDERAAASTIRNDADLDVKKRNADILASLQAAGVKRHQLPSGAIVQIIQQRPRRTVSADLLMKAGVPIDVIEACTDEKPVKPFPRVDAPDAPQPADAPAAVEDRPTRLQ